jgi:tRNA-splicing ligase RtcB (3'-phosphate/5'-hydroxy nucleic acid ligase)
MRVPGLIYADEALVAAIRRDAALGQVATAAALPGIVKASFAMLGPRVERLIDALAAGVPSGVGSTGRDRFSAAEVRRGPVRDGAGWAVARGYGEGDELGSLACSALGRLLGCRPHVLESQGKS